MFWVLLCPETCIVGMICVLHTCELMMPPDVVENQFARIVRETVLHCVFDVLPKHMVNPRVVLMVLTEPSVPFVYGFSIVNVVGLG